MGAVLSCIKIAKRGIDMAGRDRIDEKYKWKLEDIYATQEAWEADYEKLEELLLSAPDLEKKLTKSAKSLLKALKYMEEMELIAARLYVYAKMRRDENNAIPIYQAMTSRAMDINVRLSTALSFVNPVLLAMPKGGLEEFIAEGEKAAKKEKPLAELKNYSFMLKELLRNKKHILSDKEERILSMTGEISSAPKEIFTMLNNADLRFRTVKNEEGKRVPITHGSYIVLMHSKDRKVRKAAYESIYKVFRNNINTIGASYYASVKKDSFYAKARNFGSAMERALFYDNVPVELYDNLIKIMHSNISTMHRYVEVKRAALKQDEIAMYDIYAPLVEASDNEYGYERAMKMVKDGLKVLGPDYAKLLSRAQKERWIDVCETPGKTSGAYCWGSYDTHPYVLLNHRGDLDSVFTIAHELGHAMHSYYSNATQPAATAGYTIFVAEVASTVNEVLLTRYLMDTVKNKNQRRYVLNHYLDQFRTTVVRQTMFAEFEKMTHEAHEAGQPLTPVSLSQMYGELNARYHGPQMQTDELISYEWARIPHFYNAFYVYKYATGFSCAVQIASDILSGKEGAVERYIKFLSSGGSEHPLELLKIAGVYLEDGTPVEVCMKEFARALSEFESTILA